MTLPIQLPHLGDAGQGVHRRVGGQPMSADYVPFAEWLRLACEADEGLMRWVTDEPAEEDPAPGERGPRSPRDDDARTE